MHTAATATTLPSINLAADALDAAVVATIAATTRRPAQIVTVVPPPSWKTLLMLPMLLENGLYHHLLEKGSSPQSYRLGCGTKCNFFQRCIYAFLARGRPLAVIMAYLLAVCCIKTSCLMIFC
ncbi:hypothetical protein QAD02_003921 [Eretmocerus hayati]|uniref:Uncharacterized protein n=1 Tax=Eretmocerus hayati TaxID=131215 RepID=A0ACC2NNI0_9HYME|nr:hypothetical protein QAD02_003921 [Eretmocerus hayati]